MPRNTSSTASALDRPNMGAWIKFLRLLFRLINILLAFIGLGMLAYTVDIFIKYRATKHDVPTQSAVPRTLQEVPQLSAPATGSWHFRGGLNRQGILTAHDWLAGGKNSAREQYRGPRDTANHGDPIPAGDQQTLLQQPSTKSLSEGPFSIFKEHARDPPNPDPPSPYPPSPDPPTPDPPSPEPPSPDPPSPDPPEPDPPSPHPPKPEPKTKPPPPPPPKPPQVHFLWFVYAFGGAGLLTLVTAFTGLVGVRLNSRVLLGLYSSLLVFMLLGQALVAIALFADDEWTKRLPPDETGEAKKLWDFIHKRLKICKWVGLAVFAIQVVSMLLAFALSSAQQAALDNQSDEEDEVWGRRRVLLPSSGSEASGVPGMPRQRDEDPWSARMREKYGLDMAQFSYTPLRGQPRTGNQSEGLTETEPHSRRCIIM